MLDLTTLIIIGIVASVVSILSFFGSLILLFYEKRELDRKKEITSSMERPPQS